MRQRSGRTWRPSRGSLSAERVVPDPVALWTSSVFVEEARAWVAAQLAPRGSRLTGEWEQPHARVWSSTIRFETTEGRVWFKVNGSGTAYEAALIAVLGELRPGLAPDVIAHDDNRRWSLTRDGGPILRSIVAPDALWPYWERLVPRYAEAQLALAEHRPRLLPTGTPDLGPAQLPVEYRRLLAELTALSTEDGGLTREQASALERLLPAYDSWCAELATSPVPDSLQHDMPASVARRAAYRAAADLARLDLDEQVPDSIRPGHGSGLPGRLEPVVVSHRLGESEHQDAPARLVLLIDAVDLKSDTGPTYELSQRSSRRRTKNHAAVAILIGQREDLWAIPGHETDPAGAVLCQELPAVRL